MTRSAALRVLSPLVLGGCQLVSGVDDLVIADGSGGGATASSSATSTASSIVASSSSSSAASSSSGGGEGGSGGVTSSSGGGEGGSGGGGVCDRDCPGDIPLSVGDSEYILRVTTASFDEAILACGSGRHPFVGLESELDGVLDAVDDVITAVDVAWIGLRQEQGASTPVGRWAWLGSEVGGALSGPGGLWSFGSPDDQRVVSPEPTPFESEDENCGGIVGTTPRLHDVSCAAGGARWILCEENDNPPTDCTEIERCLVEGRGCTGLVACGEGDPQCVPEEAEEVCNDLDDDCDGVVDGTAADPDADPCGCGPNDGGTYRFCDSMVGGIGYRPCGEGMRLLIVDDAEERDAIVGLMADQVYLVGAYLPENAPDHQTGWRWWDGSDFDGPALWGKGEPGTAFSGSCVTFNTVTAAHAARTCGLDALPYACERFER